MKARSSRTWFAWKHLYPIVIFIITQCCYFLYPHPQEPRYGIQKMCHFLGKFGARKDWFHDEKQSFSSLEGQQNIWPQRETWLTWASLHLSWEKPLVPEQPYSFVVKTVDEISETLVSGSSANINYLSDQCRGVGIIETQFTQQYQEGVPGFIQILKITLVYYQNSFYIWR